MNKWRCNLPEAIYHIINLYPKKIVISGITYLKKTLKGWRNYKLKIWAKVYSWMILQVRKRKN